MKRWLMVPLALVAVLVLTPASEARGRKSSCGPTYCVVGYETKTCMVTSHDWITVKEKIKVTEYTKVKEVQKVTKYVAKHEVVKKPYTYYVNELVKQTRTEEYTVCELVSVVEDRPYTAYEEVRTQKTGSRKVSKMVTEEVPHKVTTYEEVRTPKTGTRKVSQTVVEEVPYSYTVDQGHWETQCHDQVCYSRKGCDSCCYTVKCYKKVWVSKPAVVSGTRKVHKCVWVDQPYNYTEISHKPVVKEEKVKVQKCVWVEEPYTYTEISHKPVQKVAKVTVHKTNLVKKSRPVDYYTCVRKEMKGEHTYTVCKYDTVVEDVTVDVLKPILVEKEVDVRKCVTVQKPHTYQVPIYGCAAPSGCCK